MESSISVAVRVRPFNDRERPLLVPAAEDDPFLGDGGFTTGSTAAGSGSAASKHKRLRSIISVLSDRVLVFDPPDREALKRLRRTSPAICQGTRPNKDVRYAFDSVWTDGATQAQIYAGTVEPLLQGVMTGYNATVFAYGATGCGKTHTISGTPEDPGLIFLAMSDLFQRAQDEADDKQIVIKISYLEIYNEQIRDLLSAEPTPPGQGLQLRDAVGGKAKISVVGLTEHTPHTPQEVLEMITEGNRRRTMSPTEANAVSSRSHAVLQVNVMQRPKGTGLTEECTSASLNIIDLAGSERASATRNRGQRMMEGANINRSLLALANCINALCRPAAAHGGIHIPYRDSKLTRLLKFSLGGNCRTVMIVCVSPSSAHFEETQKTLKYAASAKSIRTKVSQNLINVDRHVESYAKAILELQAQNQRLKRLLEEGKSASSDAEQRRKTELQHFVRQARDTIQAAASAYVASVKEKAAAEAQIDAARHIAASLRAQIAHMRSSGDAPDSQAAIASLTSSLAQHEAVLADKSFAAHVRDMHTAQASFTAAIASASQHPRFDADAREAVQACAAQATAEAEAVRNTVKYDALLQLISQHARTPASTSAPAVPAMDAPPPARSLTLSPTCAPPASAAPVRSAARMSISGKRMVASMSGGAGAGSSAGGPGRARSTTRRVSTGPRMPPVLSASASPKRASYAAATAASRTRRVGAAGESPKAKASARARQPRCSISAKPMQRRLSKDGGNHGRKRVSAAHAAQRMPTATKVSASSAGAGATERRKVSLRWKDLAGEGELEERFSLPDRSATSSVETENTSHDVDMASHAPAALDSPLKSVALPPGASPPPPQAMSLLGPKHTLDLSPTKSVAAKRLRPQMQSQPAAGAGHDTDVVMDTSAPPTTSLLSPERSDQSGSGESPPPPQATSLDAPGPRALRAVQAAPQPAQAARSGATGTDENMGPAPPAAATGKTSIFAAIAKERDGTKLTSVVRGPPRNAAARASIRSASLTRR